MLARAAGATALGHVQKTTRGFPEMIARLLRHRPSPAIVVACVALLLALGGVSWAATALPRNSVGTAQLKNNAVTSKKVRNHSLLRVDFKNGQVPRGPAGPKGATGARGPTGPAGSAGAANIKWALVRADATIVAQSGGITLTSHSTGNYILDFGSAINTKLILASAGHAGGDTGARGPVSAGPCGGTPEGSVCGAGNDTSHVRVQTFNAGDVAGDRAFYVAVFG
jgi:hypothetical protein